MNIFLIAGEASGDMHAARLVDELRARCPQARFIGLGGDRMAAAGVNLVRHCRDMAFMGLVDVVRNAGKVRNNFRIARQALLREQPDILILIDYPSFNLRLAEFCRNHLPGTRIVWYIPPKVWAWKTWRVHRIARYSDLILGIFPFEPAFYARYGYRCTYVGNPTAATIREWLSLHSPFTINPSPLTIHHSPLTINHSPLSITLLPGSRASEVRHCLPVMLQAARRIAHAHITVTAAPGLPDSLYTSHLLAEETLTRDTYSAVHSADAAVVNSGTATLETALLGCPQVAVYHIYTAHTLWFLRPILQRLLFSIPFFTLVNIIAGREVIRELVADDFTADQVEAELRHILTDNTCRNDMLAAYNDIQQTLTTADTNAADCILHYGKQQAQRS